MRELRFIDLFAGLGGFHTAAAAIGARCVFACEIDEVLRRVYEQNFGLLPAGDIRSVSPQEVPEHDILCAGFPCQPFSKAGDQTGFRDRVRGTVLFNMLEIVRVRRPEYVLLENVPHFIRHRGGKTYQTLASALQALGYTIDARELSPHQFGVPQVRWRMYLVGRLGHLQQFQWPTPDYHRDTLDIRSVLDIRPKDAASLSLQATECIHLWQDFLCKYPSTSKMPSFPIWSMEFGATYPTDRDSLHDVPLRTLRKSRGVFGCPFAGLSREDILNIVPSHARARTGAFPRWKQTFIRQNRQLYEEHRTRLRPWRQKVRTMPPSLQKLEWNCQGEERNIWQYILQFRASGLRVKRPGTAPSLVAMTTSQVPIIGWERRYMSVRECARLQSLAELRVLPTGGLAFKALGNAVSAEVARRILEKLVACTPKALAREVKIANNRHAVRKRSTCDQIV